MEKRVIVFCLLLMHFYCEKSSSAEFCVTNSTEFSAALMSASNNLEADHIKMQRGTYNVINSAFHYTGDSVEIYDFKISGGWSEFLANPCGLSTGSAASTVISGLSTHGVLDIQIAANANIEIDNISIINGQVGTRGGGIFFRTLTDYSGDVLINRVVFIGNSADLGSALSVSRGNRIEVKNSLFISNTNTSEAGSVIELTQSDGYGIYFINNTVIENNTVNRINQNGLRAFVTGSSQLYVANNILWNNGASDLIFGGKSDGFIYLYNNNILNRIGIEPNVNEGNISLIPVYENGEFLDYTPAYDSALYNTGKNPPQNPQIISFSNNWEQNSRDVFRRNRITGGRIDMGAYEAPIESAIFINGFE